VFVFTELGVGFTVLAGFRPGEKGAINAKIEEENASEGKKRKNKRELRGGSSVSE